jgi:hypothetical protein
MPIALRITKAYLQPIRWTTSGQVETIGEKLFVQFNPTTLKVNYANQKAGGDQPGTAPIQYVGKGTTKLTVELLFDVTGPMPDESRLEDVRDLTLRVAKYLEPMAEGGGEDRKYVPPGVRFGWDTFQFDGVVDSMDETLDFFSNTGKPLRATVSLQISKQEIKVTVPEGSPGTSEQHQVQDGETLQQTSAAAGRDDWQNVAAANGIENPRRMQPGALLDLKAGAGLSAGISGGVSAGISAGAGPGLSIGAANNLSLGVSGGLGFGATSRTSLSGGLGAGIGGSASVTASATAGLAGGASASTALSTRVR